MLQSSFHLPIKRLGSEGQGTLGGVARQGELGGGDLGEQGGDGGALATVGGAVEATVIPVA